MIAVPSKHSVLWLDMVEVCENGRHPPKPIFIIILSAIILRHHHVSINAALSMHWPDQWRQVAREYVFLRKTQQKNKMKNAKKKMKKRFVQKKIAGRAERRDPESIIFPFSTSRFFISSCGNKSVQRTQRHGYPPPRRRLACEGSRRWWRLSKDGSIAPSLPTDGLDDKLPDWPLLCTQISRTLNKARWTAEHRCALAPTRALRHSPLSSSSNAVASLYCVSETHRFTFSFT